jgi:hypothetical protein
VNSTLVTIHAWTAGTCLSVAVLGVMLMLTALAFPSRSAVGNRIFSSGIVTAVGAAIVYMAYLIGTGVTLWIRLS